MGLSCCDTRCYTYVYTHVCAHICTHVCAHVYALGMCSCRICWPIRFRYHTNGPASPNRLSLLYSCCCTHPACPAGVATGMLMTRIIDSDPDRHGPTTMVRPPWPDHHGPSLLCVSATCGQTSQTLVLDVAMTLHPCCAISIIQSMLCHQHHTLSLDPMLGPKPVTPNLTVGQC